MAQILSVNVALVGAAIGANGERSGIDKRPTDRAVWVRDLGPKRIGVGGGLAGDVVADGRHHGGSTQAVYAYAREDLDYWQSRLSRDLRPGNFGENLTTLGLDITDARIGERWQVGDHLVLQVTCPRIPCATFAAWIGLPGWVTTFVRAGRPGAYLRVVVEGPVSAGDAVHVVHRPAHDVTIGLCFGATTTQPQELGRLLAAGDDLDPEIRDLVERRQPMVLDDA